MRKTEKIKPKGLFIKKQCVILHRILYEKSF